MIHEIDRRSLRPSYRSDIDGLRAAAVGAVVLFHAFPTVVQSGYVGVDVFFVISGYLISSIIIAGLREGNLSIGGFYANRARRILPALLVVLAASYAFGWVSLFPDEFAQFGVQIVSSLAFVQNITLWTEVGYFDSDASLKPLLHLWSLSVEEQFYLIYPLLIVVLWKTRTKLGPSLFVLGVFSFGWNLATAYREPASAFFMPHLRFWELLAGGLLASRPLLGGALQSRDDLASSDRLVVALNNILSVLGLAIVITASLTFGGGAVYPGWRALLPVLGTCLIILAGPNGWCNRWILSDRRIVSIGLISYPLYLWHWPLLSFQRILGGHAVPVRERAAAIGLSFLLAWLTYVVVERPVRFGSKNPAKIVVLCTLGIAIGVAGYLTFSEGGLPSRRVVEMNPVIGSGNTILVDDHMVAGCGLADPANFLLCDHDKRATATLALFGDSKAGALARGLLAESGANDHWLLIGQPNEPIFSPVTGLGRDALEALAGNHDVKLVVLTMATRNLFGIWNDESIDSLPSSPNSNVAFTILDETVGTLVASGKRVVITIDNPTLHDPKFCVARATAVKQIDWLVGIGEKRTGCSIPYDRQLELTANYRAVLDRLSRKYPNHLRIFDPLPTLCDMMTKECSFLMNGKLLYSYGDHISGYAATMIAKRLVPVIEGFAAEPSVPDDQL